MRDVRSISIFCTRGWGWVGGGLCHPMQDPGGGGGAFVSQGLSPTPNKYYYQILLTESHSEHPYSTYQQSLRAEFF